MAKTKSRKKIYFKAMTQSFSHNYEK